MFAELGTASDSFLFYSADMTLRKLLLFVVLSATGWVFVGQIRGLLTDSNVWPPDDYVQYWAAGRLNLHGENPYDAEMLVPLEREAGRRSTANGNAGELDEAVMMWNPPWTLCAAMPLGALPARIGQLLWLAVGLGCIGFAADRLWQVHGGRADRRWIAWLIALTFLPNAFVLSAGQITPLVLLGATLFATSARSRRMWLAGLAAVLMAIKPHLVYLVWPLIFVDGIYRREWRIMLGGIAGGIITSAIPMLFNPDVFADYFTEMSERPPAQWVSLTLGSVLRMLLGEATFGLQFAPLPIGMIWAALYWWQRRHHWNWANELPIMLLVSFVTAPYGAWHFDLVLLMVPIIATAAQLKNSIRFWTLYTIINSVMLILNISGVASYWFAWVAPTILGIFIMERSHGLNFSYRRPDCRMKASTANC